MPKTKPPLESCLGAPIQFYNGEVTLRFATDPYHEYYLVLPDGSLEKQLGVTGVSGILDKSHYLKPWTAKVTGEKLLRIMPSEEDELGQKLVSPIPWPQFEEIVTEAKKAHTEHFEDAGNVGTQAHEIIEGLIKRAITTNEGIIGIDWKWGHEDERVVNCVKSALRWVETHQVKFLKTEHKVYSRLWKYAGTLDALAIVSACTDSVCCPNDFHKQYSLLDWKTSNQLSNDYILQTAGYQNAESEEFGIPIQARWILRIGKEIGDFESWYLPAETFQMDFDAFKLCLVLKRQMKYIEERMSSTKKTRTARKRATKKNEKTETSIST